MLLNDLYFKTTYNTRPHFLGPMGGLKIEGPLYGLSLIWFGMSGRGGNTMAVEHGWRVVAIRPGKAPEQESMPFKSPCVQGVSLWSMRVPDRDLAATVAHVSLLGNTSWRASRPLPVTVQQ